jgi:hypothetical protein
MKKIKAAGWPSECTRTARDTARMIHRLGPCVDRERLQPRYPCLLACMGGMSAVATLDSQRTKFQHRPGHGQCRVSSGHGREHPDELTAAITTGHEKLCDLDAAAQLCPNEARSDVLLEDLLLGLRVRSWRVPHTSRALHAIVCEEIFVPCGFSVWPIE